MKLSQLAAVPKLIKITLDDEATVKEYGEALDFYIYDRQPIDVFVKLAGLTTNDFAQIVVIVNEMILDESGQRIVKDDFVLPQKLYTKVVQKVVTALGE